MYAQGVRRTPEERVTEIEEQLKQKIEQRSRAGGTGGVYVLRSAFKYFDTDQSGGLDFWELKKGLELFGMQIMDHELHALMAKYDPEFNAEINYHAFLKGLMDSDWAVKAETPTNLLP